MALFRRAQAPIDPLLERIEQVQRQIQLRELEDYLDRLGVEEGGGLSAVAPNAGLTAASPFTEGTRHAGRSIIPWKRGATEAAGDAPTPPAIRSRRGYVDGLPLGGATPTNQGSTATAGAPDRATAMKDLLDAYLTCPWASTCVDSTARTITAGGLEIVPTSAPADSNAPDPTPPPGVVKVQALFDYVNPDQDIRQLMRQVVTDLEIFADSFTEVTWAYREPVALWTLDCQTMSVLSDEHGNVDGYMQKTSNGQTVIFEPWEVIHVKLDAPGAGLYGVSPTTKASVPIKTWLFAAGLIKETMKKGDPPRVHTDWPLTLADAEVRKASMQYATRNLGVRNIGNMYETKGGTTVKELSQNKIEYWLKVKTEARDEIVSTYGVPKRKVGIEESGALGGAGAETGQDKTYRVNKCGPIEELMLEKFGFALLYQAFGVKDWRIKFGEVDWRDDLIVEQIRDLRLRNGAWTRNRYAADIGEPDVEGGDDAIFVDRMGVTLWADIAAVSKATIAGKGKQPPQGGKDEPGITPAKPPTEDDDDDDEYMTPAQALGKTLGEFGDLNAEWRRPWAARRTMALAQLTAGRD